MYKISIIIPVFNVADKLQNAFNSIFNQTFDFNDLEIIFVDDCSTDGSDEIIKNFSEKFVNVKAFFLNENSGFAGKPRNIGIENASADYLMFLDPDDEFLENACEFLYENIADSSLDMVSGNYIIGHDDKNMFNWSKIDLTDGYIEIDSIEYQTNLFLLPPSVWSKIFKKEFILKKDITFPVGIPAQDVVFVYNCLLNSNGIKYINTPVVRYLPGDDESSNKSVTSTRDKKTLLGYLKAYFLAFDLFNNHENLKEFNAIHLHFWVTQLVVSNISKIDKLDLLNIAYPIFEVFKQNKNLRPLPVFEDFFKKVYNKDFISAVESCDYISMNIIENSYNILDNIKRSTIFVVLNENLELEYINQISSLIKEGYDVKIIDLNRDKLNVDINSINIFEYFSKKNALTFDSAKQAVSIKEKFDDDCSTEEFFTQDGFKYLCINNSVKLYNRFENYFLSFGNLYEFYNYFIYDLCLNQSYKPFLICNMDEINVSIAYSIKNFDFSKDFADIQNILKKKYVEDMKYNYELENENQKLKKQNKLLKNEIYSFKKANNELFSSKSWKITKPLRSLGNKFK